MAMMMNTSAYPVIPPPPYSRAAATVSGASSDVRTVTRSGNFVCSSLSASAARRAAMATIRCVLDYLEMDGWMDSNE